MEILLGRKLLEVGPPRLNSLAEQFANNRQQWDE